MDSWQKLASVVEQCSLQQCSLTMAALLQITQDGYGMPLFRTRKGLEQSSLCVGQVQHPLCLLDRIPVPQLGEELTGSVERTQG